MNVTKALFDFEHGLLPQIFDSLRGLDPLVDSRVQAVLLGVSRPGGSPICTPTNVFIIHEDGCLIETRVGGLAVKAATTHTAEGLRVPAQEEGLVITPQGDHGPALLCLLLLEVGLTLDEVQRGWTVVPACTCNEEVVVRAMILD